MSVVAVGFEHRTAPLDLLERAAVTEDALPKVLHRLADHSNLSEAVVVSTCLRTEIYAVVDRFHEGVTDLQEELAARAGRSVAGLEPWWSVRFDDDVPHHLFSVAAGLDSAVLGESEVLGQVRRSWERARDEGACGPILGGLFRHAVEVGKRVRSETAIARGITSLSHAAVALAADRRRGGLAGAAVVVLGAGDMGGGVVAALAGHGLRELAVANRTAARAEELVASVDGVGRAWATSLAGLDGALAGADVVFTAAETTRHLVDTDRLAAATGSRSGPSLLVVDLGVPRNVDPAAGALPGVELCDMDDLRAAVDAALSGRREEVAGASTIVVDEVERYRAAARARDAAPVIAALRSRAEAARQAELERQRARRGALDEAQWDEVDTVTRAVVATLLHGPTVALKDAAGTPRGERMVEALRSLFDL